MSWAVSANATTGARERRDYVVALMDSNNEDANGSTRDMDRLTQMNWLMSRTVSVLMLKKGRPLLHGVTLKNDTYVGVEQSDTDETREEP